MSEFSVQVAVIDPHPSVDTPSFPVKLLNRFKPAEAGPTRATATSPIPMTAASDALNPALMLSSSLGFFPGDFLISSGREVRAPSVPAPEVRDLAQLFPSDARRSSRLPTEK